MPDQLILGVARSTVCRIKMFNFTMYDFATGECEEVTPNYMMFMNLEDPDGCTTDQEDELIDSFWETHQSCGTSVINARSSNHLYSDIVNRSTNRLNKLFTYMGFSETEYLTWRATQPYGAGVMARLIINEENRFNQGGH